MNQGETLELAQTKDQIKFWEKFQPVNRVATSDTYKRTMSASSSLFSENFSAYNLAARRATKEEGVNGRHVMAGLEKTLYPWFMNPIEVDEVEDAREFFTKRATVKKFPHKIWDQVLENEGRLPVDVYSLPGGQTFLAKDGKHVPHMSIEGVGGIVSHLEPQFLSSYGPLVQATKARLMKEAAGTNFAEVGLRADEVLNNHVTLMHALKVGGDITLTSDDQATFLFPEYFNDIGTVGHEFLMAYQKGNLSLEEAQEKAYRAFIDNNDKSFLLPDIISTNHSGLPMILGLVKEYQGSGKHIAPRFDSGDVPQQALYWRHLMLDAGLPLEMFIIEDGYTPQKTHDTKLLYANAGGNPEHAFPAAGGYFRNGCSRDAISLAYKRSATMHDSGLESSMKLSDTLGKRSIPGQVRIYGRDDTLIVAQANESIDGVPLMQKVVENGRIIYNENLHIQSQRANDTWDQYTNIEYSPLTQRLINVRVSERDTLVARFQ